MRARPCRDSRGVAAVLSLGLIGALLMATWVAAVVVAVLSARQQAGSAADLAALAAATVQQRGGSATPCQRAAEVAQANGARVRACVVGPDGVLVEVVHPVKGVPGARLVRARARAGSGAG